MTARPSVWPIVAVAGAVMAAAAAGVQWGSGLSTAQTGASALTGVAMAAAGTLLTVLDARSLVGRVLSWCASTFGAVQLASAAVVWLDEPAATTTAWVTSWTWPLFAVPLATILPLGLPSRRRLTAGERGCALLAVPAVVLLCLGSATAPTIQFLDGVVPNPLDRPAVSAPSLLAGDLAWALAALVSLVLLARRWWRADRQARVPIQLVGATLLLALVGNLLSPVLPAAAAAVVGAVTPLALLAALTVAALRSDVWPGELALRRAQVYAIATVGVLTVYVLALAALAELLWRLPSWLAIAAAGVATAAVLEPARRWSRRRLRSRVFGDRDDPMRAVVRLREATERAGDNDAVLAAIVEQVRLSARTPGVTLLARIEGDLVPVAASGAPGEDAVALPLVHLAEDVGVLRVVPPRGESWEPADLRLLEHLAAEVAATVSLVHARAVREAVRQERHAVVAESRAQLGRDLHDTLGPVLAGTYLAAEGLSMRLGAESEEADHARRVARGVQQATAEVRRMIEQLTDPGPGLAGNLVDAVHEHADQLSATSGLRVDVDVDDLELPPDTLRAAYLIVVEALTNVVRHADATAASVHVGADRDELTILVRDDGRLGVFVAGVGLRSMRMRAAELGGSCTLRPVQPHGAELRAVLPAAVAAS